MQRLLAGPNSGHWTSYEEMATAKAKRLPEMTQDQMTAFIWLGEYLSPVEATTAVTHRMER